MNTTAENKSDFFDAIFSSNYSMSKQEKLCQHEKAVDLNKAIHNCVCYLQKLILAVKRCEEKNVFLILVTVLVMV